MESIISTIRGLAGLFLLELWCLVDLLFLVICALSLFKWEWSDKKRLFVTVIPSTLFLALTYDYFPLICSIVAFICNWAILAYKEYGDKTNHVE